VNARGRVCKFVAAVCLLAAAPPEGTLAQGYQRPQTQRVPQQSVSPADARKAQEVVAKLFEVAQAALASHRYAEATEAYEEALGVLETLYGAADERLVEALGGIVYARMSWDSYAALTGTRAPSKLDAAVEAQERIVKIRHAGADAAPAARVGAMIDLGDVYLYTDDERALDTYREAWRFQAGSESAASADKLFAAVGVVRLRLPANPPGHGEEWVATVAYDVGPDGRAAVAEVSGSVPESLAAGIRRSYAEARFRPRFIGGEPAPTTGIESSHRYLAAP
jgi:hypothetical protein